MNYLIQRDFPTRLYRGGLVAILILIGWSCKAPEKKTERIPEAFSFSGRPHFANPVDPRTLAKSDSVIASIRQKTSLTEDDFVEIGKQLAATSRYQAAIENYTEGLALYPNSYKLLRNRGHRFITVRLLNRAYTDLSQAEVLLRNETNDVMETGLDGKPTATVRHQVWYHLGVYYFLMEKYKPAADCFQKALETAGDPKNVVGASDWLFTSYVRFGRIKQAVELLETISPDLETDHENPYFRRFMIYKEVTKPEDVKEVTMNPDSMNIQQVTVLYGVANFYTIRGKDKEAEELYNKILKTSAWPSFAYIITEKQMNR